MAISGFTPTTALPGLVNGGMLAGSNPLLAAPGSVGGDPLLGAQAGMLEKPGIGTRFVNAMRAAIGELRGSSMVPYPSQTLAMQAPVTVTKPAAAKQPAAAPKKGVKAKTFTDKAGNLRQVGTGKILKPTTRVAPSGIDTVPAGMAAPVGYGAPTADLGQLTSPGSYLPGMAGALPFAGGSPFTAGAAAGVPSIAGMQPSAIPARPIA